MSKLVYIIIIIIGGVLILWGALFFGMGMPGRLQESLLSDDVKPKRIGIIQYINSLDPAVDGFKKGMVDLGYQEGRDIVYEYQTANGDIKKVHEIAKTYIAENVDLIYAITSVSGRGALEETVAAGRIDIPIVYGHADNPVRIGLAKTLKSSGNNMTGVAVDFTEVTAKKLEFLKQINPRLKNVGVLIADYSDPASDFVFAELKRQAPRFDIIVKEYPVKSPPGLGATKEIQNIADHIKPGDIDAFFQMPGSVTTENVQIIIDLEKQLKIPVAFLLLSQVKAGGLFAYGHDFFGVGQQAAVIADKVLRGVHPSDIPIEFPDKNILSVNLKTAREIEITVPESMYIRADIKINE